MTIGGLIHMAFGTTICCQKWCPAGSIYIKIREGVGSMIKNYNWEKVPDIWLINRSIPTGILLIKSYQRHNFIKKNLGQDQLELD